MFWGFKILNLSFRVLGLGLRYEGARSQDSVSAGHAQQVSLLLNLQNPLETGFLNLLLWQEGF